MGQSHTVRPGGLTTLAVINFILAGFTFIGILGSLMLLGVSNSLGNVLPTEYILLKMLLDGAIGTFLILAGVGYIQVKARPALLYGNLYVVLALIKALVDALFLNGLGQKVDMGFLVNNLYLLVTVVFINFVFSDLWSTKKKSSDSQKISSPLGLMLGYSLRQNLRSSAGVLVTFLGTTLILQLSQIPYFTIDIANSVNTTFQGLTGSSSGTDVLNRILMEFTPVLAGYLGFMGPDTSWAQALLSGPEGIFHLSLVAMTIILPYLIVMTSATQIASDTNQAGIRFLLLRASRDQIFLSKALAALIYAMILVSLITFFNFIYFTLHYGIGDPFTLFSISLKALGMNLLLTVPYVMIGIFFSALINYPAVAWLAATGAVLTPVFPFFFSLQWPVARFVELIMPTRTALFTLHPEPLMVAVGILGTLAYAGGVFYAGRTFFQKRDL